jgi:CheY-like chemotaxis protein
MPKSSKVSIKSVLVVDDDPTSLEILCHLLRENLDAEVVGEPYPSQARILAAHQSFDLVLIDVTMTYNGSPYGGLDLYMELQPRYGESALLAYSQNITDALLKQYGAAINFINKHVQFLTFRNQILERMQQLRSRQSCFIAMPFNKALKAMYRTIASAVTAAGYRCVRIDEEQFTSSIVERIFTEIRRARFVVFIATDKNPNVFYEAGYAVALNKEVLTLTETYDALPFDIRDRNTIAYGNTPKLLKSMLQNRLSLLTDIHKQ